MSMKRMMATFGLLTLIAGTNGCASLVLAARCIDTFAYRWEITPQYRVSFGRYVLTLEAAEYLFQEIGAFSPTVVTSREFIRFCEASDRNADGFVSLDEAKMAATTVYPRHDRRQEDYRATLSRDIQAPGNSALAFSAPHVAE